MLIAPHISQTGKKCLILITGMIFPFGMVGQVKLALDLDHPIDLTSYALSCASDINLTINLSLIENEDTIRYQTDTLKLKTGINSLGINVWNSIDSVLSDETHMLMESLQASHIHPAYNAHLQVFGPDKRSLVNQEFVWKPNLQFVHINSQDSSIAVSSRHWDGTHLKLKLLSGNASEIVIPTADTLIPRASLTSIEVWFDSHMLQEKGLPELDRKKMGLQVKKPTKIQITKRLPTPGFSINQISLGAAASFAKRQFSGNGLSTPFYQGTLSARGNILGLPLRSTVYGVLLRGQNLSDWWQSPMNYAIVEFDKEQFDKQYALDPSSAEVREHILSQRKAAITERIEVAAEIEALEAKTIGADSLNVQTSKSTPHTPAWSSWFGNRSNSSLNDSIGLAQRQAELEAKQTKIQSRQSEYDALLRKLDSAEAIGQSLKVSELSPSMRQEFAKSGLIKRRLERLKVLEVGHVYPHRYVSEPWSGSNEYTGFATEIGMTQKMDVYAMAGTSRFSVLEGNLKSSLIEGGIIYHQSRGKLSLLLSRESNVLPVWIRNNERLDYQPSLRSLNQTFLVFGEELKVKEWLTVGLSAEQRLGTLSSLDSIAPSGRYYAFIESSFSVIRMRFYGEYTNHKFLRNIYLSAIPGAYKTGIETELNWWKGQVTTLFGYEALVQQTVPFEGTNASVRNSNFKFAINTSFEKLPNISISHHPFYTAGRSSMSSAGIVLAYTAQTSLTQASVSYAKTAGRFKVNSLVMAQRVDNAVVYDVASESQDLRSRVEMLNANLSAFNKKHRFNITCTYQQLDNSQVLSSGMGYEYTLEKFALGGQSALGLRNELQSFQLAGSVRTTVLQTAIKITPGIMKFNDSRRLYPFTNISVSRDLFKS